MGMCFMPAVEQSCASGSISVGSAALTCISEVGSDPVLFRHSLKIRRQVLLGVSQNLRDRLTVGEREGGAYRSPCSSPDKTSHSRL